MKTYSAIILLGGSSTRFNNQINKVYLKINEKPVFLHSVDTFLKDPDCDEIIIVYNKDDFELLKSFNLDNNIILTPGGNERYESVLCGALKAKNTYVIVHDGARPNINQELINRVKEELNNSYCVSLGVPVTDTIKKVDERVETISRTNLYYMQTPQGSNKDALINVLKKIKEEDEITDDLIAFEKYSDINPHIVLGDKNNIKITTYEDYEYVKFLMEKKDV